MYVISGYQKSGTEWLKFMLVDLFLGPQDDWSSYTDAIPGVRDTIHMPKIGWVKTHEASMPRQHIVNGALHTIRHPLDVAISSYRYRLVIDALQDSDTVMKDLKLMSNYIDDFIENVGDPVFEKMNGGTWEDSVRNALEDERVVTVMHEDLRMPMHGPYILHFALDKMGLRLSFDEVQKAFDNHTPEKMRARDDRNFLNRIEVGQYKKFVSGQQLARARDAFPTAIELGYTI